MRLLLIIFACGLFNTVYGQDSTAVQAKQSVYVEIGGTGQGVSLSYDRLFRQTRTWKYGARAGVGTTSFGQFRPVVLGEVYALKGKQGKYLELGLGVSYLAPTTSTYTSDSTLVTFRGADYLWLVPRIGYRKQGLRKGNVFRVGITPPLVFQAGRVTLRPLIGLSFGQSF